MLRGERTGHPHLCPLSIQATHWLPCTCHDLHLDPSWDTYRCIASGACVRCKHLAAPLRPVPCVCPMVPVPCRGSSGLRLSSSLGNCCRNSRLLGRWWAPVWLASEQHRLQQLPHGGPSRLWPGQAPAQAWEPSWHAGPAQLQPLRMLGPPSRERAQPSSCVQGALAGTGLATQGRVRRHHAQPRRQKEAERRTGVLHSWTSRPAQAAMCLKSRALLQSATFCGDSLSACV